MQAKDIMTGKPVMVNPENTIQDAADKMAKLDTGILPVCDGRELVGVITDRDIVVRTVAAGHDPNSSKVQEAMTPEVAFCLEDEDIVKIAHRMEEHKVRRMPVINHEKQVVGMIALSDLTRHGEQKLACEILERVNEAGTEQEG